MLLVSELNRVHTTNRSPSQEKGKVQGGVMRAFSLAFEVRGLLAKLFPGES